MMKVSVVIPVFNQSQLSERCLLSLLKHSSLLDQVLIVDNASQDNTPGLLHGFQPLFAKANIHFQVITNPQNLGFGRACNQGIREFIKGKAQYLVVLNNDTWLMPAWDQALIQAIEQHHLNCVGPYFYEKPFHDSMTEIASRFVKKNGKRLRRHFVPILMCFSRATIEKLSNDCTDSNGGIFDERYFVTYEDTDLLTRMKKMGMKYGQTGSCFIWHHSKGTRNQLPSGYEQEGLRLFVEKWGFDPRAQDHTLAARLKRRYWKILDRMGIF